MNIVSFVSAIGLLDASVLLHVYPMTMWPFLQMHDGFPLRLWKVTVDVPASPEDVLTRVLREQGHWDEDLLECRTVETVNDRTDVYQYVRNAMAPHPTRDHVVLR